MEIKSVLIVDDEKNIRLTLSQTIETMQSETLSFKTDTAINGEEALNKLQKNEYHMILLDLKMPGMDGMDVLRQIVQIRPDIRVVIITAHGTIESAVEAMKLGAVDFIQKPFVPNEIRDLVLKVIDREKIDAEKASDYAAHFELAKKCMSERHIEAAIEHMKKAISLDESRPEAFNFLGALFEIRGNHYEALNNYRAALALDPSYNPALKNLHRATSWEKRGEILLGNISDTPEDIDGDKKKNPKDK